MISAFFASLNDYSRALKFMSTHKLWGFAMLPGLASLVLAGLSMYAAYKYSGTLGDSLAGFYPGDWPLSGAIDEILAGLAFIISIIVFLLLAKYVVVIIASPFLGPLSEKVESLATGKPAPPFSLKDMAEDLARAIRISLRNVIRELFLNLVLLLLNLVPFLGSVAYTIAIFAVQSYYAGFGNMDPTLERQRYTVRQRVQFVRKHRGLAIGNGLPFVLLMLVPVIGWFLAPVLGVVAATLSTVKVLEKGAFHR
ncbi:MAG: EI24 domain-containing protein [Bacteroidota bacterium]